MVSDFVCVGRKALLALGPLRSPREGTAAGANASAPTSAETARDPGDRCVRRGDGLAPTSAETTTRALVNMFPEFVGAEDLRL